MHPDCADGRGRLVPNVKAADSVADAAGRAADWWRPPAGTTVDGGGGVAPAGGGGRPPARRDDVAGGDGTGVLGSGPTPRIGGQAPRATAAAARLDGGSPPPPPVSPRGGRRRAARRIPRRADTAPVGLPSRARYRGSTPPAHVADGRQRPASAHPPPRLVKAQCIRSYGFLKALLHMVGSYIQMQLLIGRLPSCQLFAIVC